MGPIQCVKRRIALAMAYTSHRPMARPETSLDPGNILQTASKVPRLDARLGEARDRAERSSSLFRLSCTMMPRCMTEALLKLGASQLTAGTRTTGQLVFRDPPQNANPLGGKRPHHSNRAGTGRKNMWSTCNCLDAVHGFHTRTTIVQTNAQIRLFPFAVDSTL